MLKRIDHVGVIVDNLADAEAFLQAMGLEHTRDVHFEGRLDGRFYRCGETEIELIEIYEPKERERRLGGDKARVEHIAIDVDDLEETKAALAGLGVRMTTEQPVPIGANLNYWTVAESADGVMYQLIGRGAGGAG